MAAKYTTPESLSNVLTTELNSLANNGVSALGSEIDNTTDRRPLAAFKFTLAAQGTNRAAAAAVTLFLVPALDGTNYASTDAGAINNYARAVIGLDEGATAARTVEGFITLPGPYKYKAALGNYTGQAFAASGNTLSLGRFTTEDA